MDREADDYWLLHNLTTSSERFVVFEAVTGLLAELAVDQPVLLVADDLHWADLATLALLRHVARGLAGRRILLAASYRTTDVFSGEYAQVAFDVQGQWVKDGFDAVAWALKARAEELHRA